MSYSKKLLLKLLDAKIGKILKLFKNCLNEEATAWHIGLLLFFTVLLINPNKFYNFASK
jgi:hypothetical protein